MIKLAALNVERLERAARRLARDIYVMRSEFGCCTIYAELYAARCARLSAVTRRKIKLNRLLRQQPRITVAELETKLIEFEIPQTTDEITQAIRACELKAVNEVREKRNRSY